MLDDALLTFNVIAFVFPIMGAAAIASRSKLFAAALFIAIFAFYDLSWRVGGFPQWGYWLDRFRVAVHLP